jgi:hypothetical protein
MEAGVGLALSSSLLAVLAFGGQQVIDGSLSYGDLSSFFMYTLSLGFSAGEDGAGYGMEGGLWLRLRLWKWGSEVRV